MRAKVEELKKSRELRKEGYSLGEISKLLKVSKGSVSLWVRDVEMPEDKKLELLERTENKLTLSIKSANLANTEKFKYLRELYQEEGRKLAKLNDPHFFSGCMLYWAEGNKSRRDLVFTNSDPNMLKYFISFLLKYFNIEYKDISISCLYYSTNLVETNEVEKYWINILKFPVTCLRKTTINRTKRTSNKERQERTKYGVLRIKIGSVKILQMIYGALQEIANFSNKDWIEGYY